MAPVRKATTPQEIAAEFSGAMPVGTPCLYYPLRPFQRSEAVETVIRSEPWVLGHGAVVVKVEGRSGGVAIEHIGLPIPTNNKTGDTK